MIRENLSNREAQTDSTPMALVLDCNSEHGAHLCSKPGISIC